MSKEQASIKQWAEAARPRTLAASISPVILGGAIAWYDSTFKIVPFILCIFVALFAQIASNFANDYFDYKKGADTDKRTGPDRAVAKGWITPAAMLRATLITVGLSCLCGLLLLFYASWIIIPVGIAIALCVFAYSAGPYPLSYHGWGDVCVLLFYGIVPVCFTYFVQSGTFSLLSLLLSIGIGLLSTNILIVNNYRDCDEDRANGKRTTVVLFGRRFALVIYLINGLIALLISAPLLINAPAWTELLLACYFALFFYTWLEMKRNKGQKLNAVLGHTSRNVLLYAIIVSFLLVMYAVPTVLV